MQVFSLARTPGPSRSHPHASHCMSSSPTTVPMRGKLLFEDFDYARIFHFQRRFSPLTSAQALDVQPSRMSLLSSSPGSDTLTDATAIGLAHRRSLRIALLSTPVPEEPSSFVPQLSHGACEDTHILTRVKRGGNATDGHSIQPADSER